MATREYRLRSVKKERNIHGRPTRLLSPIRDELPRSSHKRLKREPSVRAETTPPRERSLIRPSSWRGYPSSESEEMTDYPRSTESIVRDTNVPFPRAGTSLDEPGADCVPDGDDEDGDDAATPTAEDPEERSVRLTLKEYVDAQSAFGEPIPTPTPRLNHELNILLRYHSIRLDLKDASALNVVENLRRDGIVRGEEGAYEKFATDAYMKMRRQLDYEAKTVTVRIDNRTMTVGELKDFLLRNMQRREFIQSSVNQAMNPNKAPGADFEGQGDKRRLVLTKRRLNNATPQTEPEKLPW